ncbi:PqqD family protein [bacterium]|nr:PqqD family protein [bacterium]
MPSHPNFKIDLAPNLTLTEMEGKWVLFSKHTGDFFGLNESAGIFLNILIQNDFLTSLKLARKEFDAPEEVLERDFLELIHSLESQKLLKKLPL